MERRFARLSAWLSQQVGRSHTFVAALLLTVAWVIYGSINGFSDLLLNVVGTVTNVLGLLLLFLLQSSQTHDTLALQTKLDEILRAIPDASNQIIGIEALSEEELLAQKQSLLG